MKLLLLLLCVVALSGCATYQKLPEITAESFDYRRTDPFGGTQIHADKVQNLPDKVIAENVTWSTTYPQFTVAISVKNYTRLKAASP